MQSACTDVTIRSSRIPRRRGVEKSASALIFGVCHMSSSHRLSPILAHAPNSLPRVRVLCIDVRLLNVVDGEGMDGGCLQGTSAQTSKGKATRPATAAKNRKEKKTQILDHMLATLFRAAWVRALLGLVRCVARG
jgi:hypothetical protein